MSDASRDGFGAAFYIDGALFLGMNSELVQFLKNPPIIGISEI